MRFFSKIKDILLGNMIYSASQFAILMIIVKFGSSHDLGIYTLTLSIVTPLSVFFGFQLRNQLAIDSKGNLRLEHVLSIRNILNLFLILTTFLIYFFTRIELLIIFGFYKVVESYYEIAFGLLLKNSQNEAMGRLLSVKSISNVITFAIVYLISRDLYISIISQIMLMSLLFVLYNYFYLNIGNSLKINYNLYSYFLKTLPLAISALLISFTPQIPRYFLGVYDSVETVGVFSSLAYFIVLGTLVINSINSSFYSKYSTLIAEKKYREYLLNLKSNIYAYSLIWGILCLFVLVFRERLLLILFNPSFTDYFLELIIICFGSIFLFLSTLFINFTLFNGTFYHQLYIYLIVSFISIIICYLLIPQYGILGASISLVLSYFTQMLVSLIFFILLFRKKVKNEK